MSKQIILRDEAIEDGLYKFYSGKLCKQGHDSERYTANGQCVVCSKNAASKREKARHKPATTEEQAMFTKVMRA
jgi:hypothetical protein